MTTNWKYTEREHNRNDTEQWCCISLSVHRFVSVTFKISNNCSSVLTEQVACKLRSTFTDLFPKCRIWFTLYADDSSLFQLSLWFWRKLWPKLFKTWCIYPSQQHCCHTSDLHATPYQLSTWPKYNSTNKWTSTKNSNGEKIQGQSACSGLSLKWPLK